MVCVAAPSCRQQFSDITSYQRHLVDSHNLPPNGPVAFLANIGFMTGIKDNCQKFASVCDACRAKAGSVDHKQENTDQENIRHVYNHLGVPTEYCTKCSLYFTHTQEATAHSKHSDGHTIIKIASIEYFAGNANNLAQWTEGIAPFCNNLNRHLERIKDPNRRHVSVTQTPREDEISMMLIRCENDISSLNDFKGSYTEIFKSFGDFQVVIRAITSSSKTAIDLCCREIEPHAEDLIMNSRGSHAIAVLTLYCGTELVETICQLFENDRSRNKFFNAIPACHFIRKVMTSKSLNRETFDLLYQSLFSDDWITQANDSTNAGIIFSVATNSPGYAAANLCDWILRTGELEYMATNVHLNRSIRNLIYIANYHVTDYDREMYQVFLSNVVQAWERLLGNKEGQKTLQCIMYYNPLLCSVPIFHCGSIDFIFGRRYVEDQNNNGYNFENTNICEIIQVAIEAMTWREVLDLLDLLTPRDLNKLIFSRCGNNIVRAILKKLVNYVDVRELSSKLEGARKRMNTSTVPKFVPYCFYLIDQKEKLLCERERDGYY